MVGLPGSAVMPTFAERHGGGPARVSARPRVGTGGRARSGHRLPAAGLRGHLHPHKRGFNGGSRWRLDPHARGLRRRLRPSRASPSTGRPRTSPHAMRASPPAPGTDGTASRPVAAASSRRTTRRRMTSTRETRTCARASPSQRRWRSTTRRWGAARHGASGAAPRLTRNPARGLIAWKRHTSSPSPTWAGSASSGCNVSALRRRRRAPRRHASRIPRGCESGRCPRRRARSPSPRVRAPAARRGRRDRGASTTHHVPVAIVAAVSWAESRGHSTAIRLSQASACATATCAPTRSPRTSPRVALARRRAGAGRIPQALVSNRWARGCRGADPTHRDARGCCTSPTPGVDVVTPHRWLPTGPRSTPAPSAVGAASLTADGASRRAHLATGRSRRALPRVPREARLALARALTCC